MSEGEEPIPENTCETIQITKDILPLFKELEEEYNRIKEEIKGDNRGYYQRNPNQMNLLRKKRILV